jgi:hypothetical protein
MSSSLLTRLGYPENETVLIVSCDELGFCQAANAATYELIRAHHATSTSLMVPAPWSRAAAADHRGEDVGVNLTIISELERYRWGPITQAPSLLDGDGAFPRTIDDVWEHADLDEVRREWRAQIERAVLWGFDVTHLVMHFDAIEQRPEFFDVYLDLAEDFRLPVRLIGTEAERQVGFPIRELAEARGVVVPDSAIELDRLGSTTDALTYAIDSLPAGVHEIICRVALDSDEIREATPLWEERVNAYSLLGQMDWNQVSAKRTNFHALSRLMREDA